MKKQRILFSTIFALASVALSAQVSDPVILMTVGGRPVSLAEFKSMYYNNFPKDSVKDQKSLNEYLELFEEFRLKVNAAIDARIDTTASFKKEISDYRQKAVEPKMRDTAVENRLIKEAYQRMKWDVKASHILIKVGEDAAPADTLAAYNKITEIRAKIVSKKMTFEAAAKEYSDDTYSKEKGGDLGYFTSLGMLYSFENAAYNGNVGDVTKPVRTKYGYHILKITDKRADVGQIEVAHIMLRTPQKMTADDSLKIAAKADSIYQLAKAGQDFSELAKKYSQDQGTAKHGGMLPWFGVGKYAKFPAFESAAFLLKNVGDVAVPVRTQYGWHIIKLLGKKPVQPFDSVKEGIATRLQKDTRSEAAVDAVVSQIKVKYKFTEYPEAKKEMYGLIDTSFYKGKWSADKAKGHTQPLFSLQGKNYTQEDFADFLAKNQMNGTQKGGEFAVNMLYPKYVKKECLQYKDDHLEQEDPVFKEMLSQYEDGILLFDITDELVWTKAMKDSTGLKAFYETVKNKYMWQQRCDATVYTCSTKDVAKEVKTMIKEGKTDKDIQTEINGKTANSLTFNTGKFSKNDNATVDATKWKKGISDEMEINGKVVFVNVRDVIPAEPKELDAVRGIVTTDYQTYLMAQWLKDLKAKYPIVINQQALGMVLPGR